MSPQELKQTMSAGLLSFPVTDFNASGDFSPDPYTKRLEWLMPYGATVLFAAGGTGEFFSLTHSEYSNVVGTAVDTCRGGSAHRGWCRVIYSTGYCVCAGSGAAGCAGDSFAAALFNLSGSRRIGRARRGGVSVREIWRHHLQPRGVSTAGGDAGEVGQPLSQPDRVQGWHWRH